MLKGIIEISRKFVFLLLAIPANYVRSITDSLFLGILVFVVPIFIYYAITFGKEYKKGGGQKKKKSSSKDWGKF